MEKLEVENLEVEKLEVEKLEVEKLEVEKLEVEKLEVEKEVEKAEVKKVEKHISNISHCKCDFMNHIYTISLPFLAKCTSLRNALMIFLFARSSFSIFLYSSLQMLWYSVCMRSLVSHPGCAFIQSWMTRVW